MSNVDFPGDCHYLWEMLTIIFAKRSLTSGLRPLMPFSFRHSKSSTLNTSISRSHFSSLWRPYDVKISSNSSLILLPSYVVFLALDLALLALLVCDHFLLLARSHLGGGLTPLAVEGVVFIRRHLEEGIELLLICITDIHACVRVQPPGHKFVQDGPHYLVDLLCIIALAWHFLPGSRLFLFCCNKISIMLVDLRYLLMVCWQLGSRMKTSVVLVDVTGSMGCMFRLGVDSCPGDFWGCVRGKIFPSWSSHYCTECVPPGPWLFFGLLVVVWVFAFVSWFNVHGRFEGPVPKAPDPSHSRGTQPTRPHIDDPNS